MHSPLQVVVVVVFEAGTERLVLLEEVYLEVESQTHTVKEVKK
jgi:hypothetical protein